MENNKNKKSVKFQGDVLNFCDFIQVFVFTRNHHLKSCPPLNMKSTVFSKVYFQQNLDTNDSFSLFAQPDHM